MNEQIQRAAQLLRQSRRVSILTGAGISKESGIPTFRDALEGLWAQFDPADLATPAAFRRNPKLVWDWYESRRQKVCAAQPNAGHYALAALEKRIEQVAVITQNVDGLHRAAGSTDVIELHGNITQHKCFSDCRGLPTLIDLATLRYDADAGPPHCPHCGAYVRPNVVWFTEMLPPDALERAQQLAINSDVMLVIGTSGVVEPAASLPYIAKRFGAARLIDVNPAVDEIARIADLFLQGPAGQILPQMIRAMDER